MESATEQTKLDETIHQSSAVKAARQINDTRRSKQPAAIRKLFYSSKADRQDAQSRIARTFVYRIGGISASFETAVSNPFISVEVGGRFVEVQTDVPIPQKKTKQAKKKDKKKKKQKDKDEAAIREREEAKADEEGKDEQGVELQVVVVEGEPERGTGIQEPREIQYRKTAKLYGHRNVHFTMARRRAKPKDDVVYSSEFTGIWRGSYEDLSEEDIRLEAWNRQLLGGNTLVGGCAVKLRDLVDSSTTREFELVKSYPASSSSGQVICRIRLQILFEERYDYVIDVRRWDIESLGNNIVTNNDSKDKGKLSNPTLLFSSTRKLYTDQFTLAIRQLFRLVQGFPFDGHVPALTSPLSFILPFKLLPKLSSLSNLFESPLSQATIAVASQDHVPNRSRFLPHASALHYRGTRSQLEAERLDIVLSEELSNKRQVSTTSSFEGILDYGFLEVQLEDAYRAQGAVNLRPSLPQFRQFGRYEQNLQESGSIFSNLFCCCLPQLDSVDRHAGGTLEVKVQRARGLYSLVGYREMLCPNVSVEWNHQQRETEVAEETSEPFWGETLSFRLPRDSNGFVPASLMSSVLSFKVWDNENLGKDPLGYAQVDFAVILSACTGGDGGTSPSFTFSKTLLLNIPEHYRRTGSSPPSLEVEVSFLKDLAPGELRSLLKYKAENGIGNNPETKMHQEITSKEFSRASQAWIDVQSNLHRLVGPEMHRYFPFKGQDETTGAEMYLPRLLGPIYPPSGLGLGGSVSLDDDPTDDFLYFVHNIEYKGAEILSRNQKRLAIEGKVAQGKNVVNNLPKSFNAQHKHTPPVGRWMDPYTFLERRSGDFRDHAVLLCSLLMSLGRDVYVVGGTAQSMGQGVSKTAKVEHYWVMTRETDGSIKFWEASTLKVYTIDAEECGRRWRDVDKLAAPIIHSIVKPVIQNLDDQEDSELSEEGPLRIDGDAHVHVRNVVGEKFSIFDQKQQSQQTFHTAFAEEDTERIKSLGLDDFKQASLSEQLPYLSVDVVFNNAKLYANLQDADPTKVDFSLDDQTRWFQFPYELPSVQPYYERRTLRGLAPRQMILDLQHEITQSISVAIQQFREVLNIQATSFFPDDELQLIHRRLSLEEFVSRLEFYQPSPEMEFEKGSEHSAISEAERQQQAKSALQRMDESFSQHLADKLQEGYTYKESRLRFKHTNTSKIADIVVSSLKNGILDIPEEQSPFFVVAARTERLPSFVTTVRVLIGVVYRLE